GACGIETTRPRRPGGLCQECAAEVVRKDPRSLPGGAPMMSAALFTFLTMLLGLPVLLAIARIFGLYTKVNERTCRVYVLFGKVAGVLDEPGLHILPLKIGLSAFIVNLFGKCYVLDLRLDQEYRRS